MLMTVAGGQIRISTDGDGWAEASASICALLAAVPFIFQFPAAILRRMCISFAEVCEWLPSRPVFAKLKKQSGSKAGYCGPCKVTRDLRIVEACIRQRPVGHVVKLCAVA